RTSPLPPAERPPIPVGSGLATNGSGSPLDDPRALQILTTEHWSLLATRSLSYNEAFTRAGIFLTALSASMVAIAFVAQADPTGEALRIFALVLLAFDLFVGLTTYLRLLETTQEDFRCVQGMNRIRHAYLEMTPGLARYFVTSDRDDLEGVLATYEGTSATEMAMGRVPFAGLLHGFSTNTGMVGVVVSLVGGSLAGVVVAQFGVPMLFVLVAGIVVFVLLDVVLARLAINSVATFGTPATTVFPSDAAPGGVDQQAPPTR
ncbi:MAG: hypothetical protein ACJ761_05325, partial [Chloroflexota bacterium]